MKFGVSSELWLLGGAGFFAGVPFLYPFVHAPEHPLVLRLVHGLPTAWGTLGGPTGLPAGDRFRTALGVAHLVSAAQQRGGANPARLDDTDRCPPKP